MMMQSKQYVPSNSNKYSLVVQITFGQPIQTLQIRIKS